MKYVKMFGLAALAAALMAFAAVGTASATTLDDAEGAMGVGDTIAAESEGTTELHPPIGSIKCEESQVGGEITNAGGEGVNVSGNITALSWSKCNATVTVLAKGTLSVSSSGSNNGALSSTGAQVTVSYLGFHCIFTTNNTALGTVTGSANTGGNATLDIKATIPRTGGSSGAFCGSTAAWTGSYKVTTPGTLNIT